MRATTRQVWVVGLLMSACYIDFRDGLQCQQDSDCDGLVCVSARCQAGAAATGGGTSASGGGRATGGGSATGGGTTTGTIVYQLGTVEPLNWPGGSPLFYSGETNYLTIALSNQGTTRAYAVSGWLTPKSASVSVTSSPAPLQFGDLAERGGTGCGTTVTAAAGLCNTSVMNFPVITAPAHFSDPHAQFTLSILDSRNLPPTVFTIEVPVYARPP